MRISPTTTLLAVGLALACAPDRGVDKTTAAATTSTDGGSVAPDTVELARLAQEVTRRGLRIRKGDVVMIAGGAHTVPIMEALALETARVGGQYNLQLQSQRLLRAELTEIPEEFVGLPPNFFADWLRSTTVYIGLPGLTDPEAAFAGVPESRLAKWNAGFSAIHGMLNGSPVRGAFIEYPSPGTAAAVGMDPDAFARMLTTTKATLVVYGRALEDPCELTEADVLARGTGRLVFTNNNVFVDNSRDTKAGYIVTGDVTLPDGRRAHLHARLRLRIVDGEFQVLTEEFTLRPIGG